MSNLFIEGHALIVGAGDDLQNTIKDAQGLAGILLDEGRCAYVGEQVHLLTDRDASREKVLSAMEELSRKTDENSSVIIYFSGHGQRVTTATGADSFYLMTYGYDPDRLAETAIHEQEFVDRLRGIKAQKVLLLLDCCHAGRLSEIGDAKAKSARVKTVEAPLPPEALTLLSEGSGRVIIASSTEEELSFTGDPYSAFTMALIEALCGAGVSRKDGYVRVSDLAMYTANRVPGLTQEKQHPTMHWEQGENFRVAYYASGSHEPKALPAPALIEPEAGAWKFNKQGQIILIDQSVNTIIDQSVKGTFINDRMTVRGNSYMSNGPMTFNHAPPPDDKDSKD